MSEEIPSLAEALKDIEGPILPDWDHPFMVWVRQCAKIQLLLHEIDKNLYSEFNKKGD